MWVIYLHDNLEELRQMLYMVIDNMTWLEIWTCTVKVCVQHAPYYII
jgi:hypothetical protein